MWGIHTHWQNLKEKSGRYSRGLHGRRWWSRTFQNKKGHYEDIRNWFYLEWHFGPLVREFSVRLHFGNAGSETPIDAHVSILGQAIYVHTELGRRLAHWLTSRKGGYHRRDISLRKHEDNSRIYWQLWADPDSGRKTWRDGSVDLSLLNRLWGPKRYTYENLASGDTHLIFVGEEPYPVTLTIQKMQLRRTKRANKIYEERLTIDVSAPKGVPTHVDHSGGWKGDRTYGWSVMWPEEYVYHEDTWLGFAHLAVTRDVLQTRWKTGFVAPDPVES